MRKEEYEFLVRYLENMRDTYIGGEEYETHPLSEYDALDLAIKSIRKLKKIEQIIETHDADSMPEDYFYIDRIREVLSEDNL